MFILSTYTKEVESFVELGDSFIYSHIHHNLDYFKETFSKCFDCDYDEAVHKEGHKVTGFISALKDGQFVDYPLYEDYVQSVLYNGKLFKTL